MAESEARHDGRTLRSVCCNAHNSVTNFVISRGSTKGHFLLGGYSAPFLVHIRGAMFNGKNKLWRRYVINLGGPGLRSEANSILPQSSFFLPSLGLPRGLCRARSPVPNILMQLIQSNSFTKSTSMFNVCYTRYRNQCTCRVQLLSAELMLWTTGHV